MADRCTPGEGEKGVSPSGFSQPGLAVRLSQETGRISRQHRRIASLSDMVVAAVASGSLHNARLSFTRFRDAIEAHVSVEEQLFFPAVRGYQPSVAPILSQLIAEHVQFAATMEDLYDLLAKGSAEAFQAGFEALQADFADHEAREEQLVASTRTRPT